MCKVCYYIPQKIRENPRVLIYKIQLLAGSKLTQNGHSVIPLRTNLQSRSVENPKRQHAHPASRWDMTHCEGLLQKQRGDAKGQVGTCRWRVPFLAASLCLPMCRPDWSSQGGKRQMELPGGLSHPPALAACLRWQKWRSGKL